MKYSKKVSDTCVREVKKNRLEPADGLKKKKKISDRQRRESHSAKHHVWTNPTFTKTLLDLVNK